MVEVVRDPDTPVSELAPAERESSKWFTDISLEKFGATTASPYLFSPEFIGMVNKLETPAPWFTPDFILTVLGSNPKVYSRPGKVTVLGRAANVYFDKAAKTLGVEYKKPSGNQVSQTFEMTDIDVENYRQILTALGTLSHKAYRLPNRDYGEYERSLA